MSTTSPAPSQVSTMTMPGPKERRYSPADRGTGASGGSADPFDSRESGRSLTTGADAPSPDSVNQLAAICEAFEIVEEMPDLMTPLVGMAAGQVGGDVATSRAP